MVPLRPGKWHWRARGFPDHSDVDASQCALISQFGAQASAAAERAHQSVASLHSCSYRPHLTRCAHMQCRALSWPFGLSAKPS
jgi:hypothetical protein